jgi:YD repeat-containing protein
MGHSTKYDYDKSRKLTKFEQYRLIDDTLVKTQEPEYQVTTYERNKKGEVIAVTSPLGDVVKYGYDKTGNVISKLDEEQLETLYDYNIVGKLTKVSYADGKTVETF